MRYIKKFESVSDVTQEKKLEMIIDICEKLYRKVIEISKNYSNESLDIKIDDIWVGGGDNEEGDPYYLQEYYNKSKLKPFDFSEITKDKSGFKDLLDSMKKWGFYEEIVITFNAQIMLKHSTGDRIGYVLNDMNILNKRLDNMIDVDTKPLKEFKDLLNSLDKIFNVEIDFQHNDGAHSIYYFFPTFNFSEYMEKTVGKGFQSMND